MLVNNIKCSQTFIPLSTTTLIINSTITSKTAETGTRQLCNVFGKTVSTNLKRLFD